MGAKDVCDALEALLGNPGQDVLTSAQQFLQDFQRSVDAWQTSNEILNADAAGKDVQLFCAQSLKYKIQFQYHELEDTDVRMSIRNSLVELMLRFANGPQNILTQICLGLAVLAIQMEEWVDVVEDTTKIFGQEVDTGWSCLLEFLTVLPEEAHNQQVPIGERRRKDVSEKLAMDAGNVLALLGQFMAGTGSDARKQVRVFKAFWAWLRCGVPIVDLANSELLGMAFEALQSEVLQDVASDVIVQLIRNSQNVRASEPVLQQVIPRVLDLRGIYMEALENEDVELLRNLTRIFAEMGERYLDLIVQGNMAYKPEEMVGTLLMCGANPDPEIASITFMFWYKLMEELQHPGTDDARVCYAPAFLEMVKIVHNGIQRPVKFDTRSDEESFFKYRQEAADALKDAAMVVGGRDMLALFVSLLTEQMTNPETWQPIEATLYCIRMIARYVNRDETTYMPQILQFVPHVPHEESILYQTILLLGAFSEWINSNPDFLEGSINFALEGLNSPGLSGAAAITLRNVCDACAELMAPNIDHLVDVYEGACGRGSELSSKSRLEVVKAVAHVISVLPLEHAASVMERMYMPMLELIHEIAVGVQENPAILPNVSDELTVNLNQMSALIEYSNNNRHLEPGQDHPCIQLLHTAWPDLERLLTSVTTDEATMEAICDKVLKFTIKSTQQHFADSMAVVIDMMVQCFRVYPHSCFVYVFNLAVGVFGGNPSYKEAMGQLLETFSVATFELLNVSENFKEHPDVVVEYFEVVIRFLRRRPAIVVSPMLPTIVSCSVAGMEVQHERACKSILAFFEHLVRCAAQTLNMGEPLDPQRLEVLQGVVMDHGESLVAGVIDSILNYRTFASDIAAILTALKEACHDELLQWLYNKLSIVPDHLLTPNDKTEFMGGIGEAQDKAAVKRLLLELNSLYRSRSTTTTQSR